MRIKLGDKIKELRKRDGRKQEDLANALGVTNQAVSRWESNGCYPDMEIIPSIANYFGITIDELFGYQNDREVKVDKIIDKINSYNIKSRGDDAWVDECVFLLREGLAEFPNHERLMITLAETLTEAGWRRYGEWCYYDENGYLQHNYDKQKKNEYWLEAIKICEYLVGNTKDNVIVERTTFILVILYQNLCEYQKAIHYAMKMPTLEHCREFMLAKASDGKAAAEYIGDFLLKSARAFTSQLIVGVMTNLHHFESDMPIEKVKGAIAIFELLCEDGNFGKYHGDIIQLNLYLSILQWERGYQDEAFVALDEALKHARALEKIADGKEHTFTAALVSGVKYKIEKLESIAKQLPEDWPMWSKPDYSQTKKEIKADPRWMEWVIRTQE